MPQPIRLYDTLKRSSKMPAFLFGVVTGLILAGFVILVAGW